MIPHALSGRVWHQGHPWYGLLSFQDPTRGSGRYHRVGEEGLWYASNPSLAVWAQLFRGKLDDDLSPFTVSRRVGRCRIRSLVVLDLSNDQTRRVLGVTLEDLRSDDYTRCQAIADQMRAGGFEGILAPSAALEGAFDVVVFKAGIPKVVEEYSRVQPPPRSMRKYPHRILRRSR